MSHFYMTVFKAECSACYRLGPMRGTRRDATNAAVSVGWIAWRDLEVFHACPACKKQLPRPLARSLADAEVVQGQP